MLSLVEGHREVTDAPTEDEGLDAAFGYDVRSWLKPRRTGRGEEHVSRAAHRGSRARVDAFNRHDLDAIMTYFADDCVFESPRTRPLGCRFVGKNEVRRGLGARFKGIPDVRYGDGDHFACRSRGLSAWTISGTTVDGKPVEVRGCDPWTFGSDDRIIPKDSFWKIRDT